jgi:hypothetical protein
MTYKDWFASHRDQWESNAKAITVTSDKLGSKAEMLSLTLTPLFESPEKAKTFFIAGGDPSANRHITGIDLDEFNAKALGRMACSEVLKEELADINLLVSYSTRFYTQGLLEKTFPEIFLKKSVLDVVSMYKLHSNNMTAKATDTQTLRDLIYWTEIESMSISGSFSLANCVYDCNLLIDENIPQYLHRGREVTSLFNHIIT